MTNNVVSLDDHRVVRPMRHTETTEPFTLKDTEDYMQMRLPVWFYNLRPGDVVKLGFDFGYLGVEWMWVIVETPLVDGRYSGMLNNDPVCGGIPCGYRFDFEPSHVLKVETDRASPPNSVA